MKTGTRGRAIMRIDGAVIIAGLGAILLTGCGGFNKAAPSGGVTLQVGPALQGHVHGGQQPIAGATILLYAAGVSGYSSTNQNLLTAAVSSGQDGSFSLSGLYSCTPGQQLYLVALGGNPGAGTNPNSALMAALGDCSGLSASTFISVNEVTTVGSVFALSPFMSSVTVLSSSPTNAAGLARAFTSVRKLVNTASGQALGTVLPPGAIGPTAEINTLANILAACINSTGGAAGDSTPCGQLFALATAANQPAPVDTIGAALSMAHNPALNTAALFALPSPQSPFAPLLATAPRDWTMSVVYTQGFKAPTSTTVDANGNIWVANSGNDSVSVIAQSGALTNNSPLTANGLAAPSAIAIDASGNAWITNGGGTNLSAFLPTGLPLMRSPFVTPALDHASALAIDRPGNVWVASSGNDMLVEMNGTGQVLRQLSVAAPTAVAIDPK